LVLAVACVMLAPLAFLLSRLVLWLPGRSAQVSASPMGLKAQLGPHERAFDAATIAVAVVVPRYAGAELQLTLTSGDELIVWVDSVATAEALLATLALDPSCRRTDVRWSRWAASVGAGVLGFV